jgi:hypothetical protein
VYVCLAGKFCGLEKKNYELLYNYFLKYFLFKNILKYYFLFF